MRLRADIQGLRAIAVAMVVLYHLAPQRLTGGFVGVDVFFVISGFLITSHLLARPPQAAGDLVAFWGRRIRRLLPAALLVLAATLLGARLFLPDTRWSDTAGQVEAAALYVVNWRLAHDAVDYLAADNAASPVQHFWSLSVEEQFYLGWPLLILVLGLLGALAHRSRAVLAAGLGLVVAGSLAWSVHLTAADPAAAYFVTPTRIWELGIGGLLALAVPLLRLGRGTRRLLAWAGLLVLAAVALTYDARTPFPGWQAAVPVLASAAVIAADADLVAWSPVRLLARRPVQWLGDVSYAVYLWHWPLIVLLPAALHSARGRLDDVAIVALTLALAAATKRWVEDPFRSRAWTLRVRGTYVLGAAAMAVVLLAGTGLTAEVHHRQDVAVADLHAALAGHDPCFGAAALDPGRSCPAPTGAPVPAPALAAKDHSAAYRKQANGQDCWADQPAFAVVKCTFGSGPVTVALVGNSHAGQWLPALQQIAAQQHWRVTTYLASQCALADVRQSFPEPAARTGCQRWARRTTARVRADHPDLIVVANRLSLPVEGAADKAASVPLYRAGVKRLLTQWQDIPVVAIRDTPAPGDGGDNSIPDCLAAHPDDLDACDGPRSVWEPADPTAAAARELPNARVVDVDDHICGPKTCTAVIGGVVGYFDGSHLTATFARTLAPYLAPTLVRALEQAR